MYMCPYDASWLLAQRYRSDTMGISKSEVYLRNVMRMLWEQHIVWTRMTILSIIKDLPDVDFVTKRLLQNPIDFKKVLIPFYGDEIASQFSDLLTSHLVIAAQLVKASKAGYKNEASATEKSWYKNADEVAVFLNRINPYWSEQNWKTMLYEHLKLVKSEAVDILTNNYIQSIVDYDEIEKQALKMADVMAEGIVKQFQ
jgi:hypothetical protein